MAIIIIVNQLTCSVVMQIPKPDLKNTNVSNMNLNVFGNINSRSVLPRK